MTSTASQRGRDLESMVDAQIRRWRAERAAAEERDEGVKEDVQPIITISREYGARGHVIGRSVAKKLGFAIWDHEIVHEIAEKTGAREALLDTLDEHARTAMQELFATLRGGDEAALAYARQLSSVIHSVAHHGAAVVVGRGGQFITAGEAAFRVRILQPLDERVADFASRHEISEEEAARRIQEVERDRRSFCRQHFGEDVAAPEHYDLIVNRRGKSVAETTAMIVAAYKALQS